MEVFSGRGEVSRAMRDVPWHMRFKLHEISFEPIHKRPLIAVMKE